MLPFLKSSINDFAHLFFPHNCLGCESDAIEKEQLLCSNCLAHLPYTGFEEKPGNRVEKVFYGRVPIKNAASIFYFTKHSLLQHILNELKYRGNKHAGIMLGRLAGYKLAATTRFDEVDFIVPLPLNEKKERKRGYNQAQLIAEGIIEIWKKPVKSNLVIRTVFTETQTHKDRENRWVNMEGVFKINDEGALTNKHVLLVDDIITTGATLEACGSEILKVPGATLSILSVAYTI